MSDCKLVLTVEDDSNDAMLLQTAFAEIRPEVSVRVATDGDEAIHYLRGSGKYSDREAYPFPALMLLDMKLPRLNGLGVLRWLHEHPAVKATLRVVVLTSFISPETERAANELGADELREKPLGYSTLKEQLQTLATRWLDPASLPG